MTGYEEIEFGTRSKSFDCAFVWIYARNCTPYTGYPYNDIPNVSLVLAEMRYDGLFGAVGGAVEENDLNLEVAVQREAMEEIAYDLPIERLEPLATYKNQISGTHIHSFSLEVTYEELLEIRKNAYDGKHFNAENAGINLLHICRYLKGGKIECGWNAIKEQQFVSTSKMELIKLAITKNLVIDYVGNSQDCSNSYKMFIDDLRDVEKYYPNEEFVTVRTYQEAVQYVQEHGLPSFVSFDHDFGDAVNEDEETGYTFAKYLIEYMNDNQITVPFEYQVHSSNPVGAMNITSYLKNAFKFIPSL